jgi:site-specific recombinase XerD
MLERYFVSPGTIDRVQASWIGAEIEAYVVWLAEHGYSARTVVQRVPMLMAFGEFAGRRGARVPADLPAHVEAFVDARFARHDSAGTTAGGGPRPKVARQARGVVEQMLRVVLPGFEDTGGAHRGVPFADAVPGFFDYLVSERGLRPASVRCYRQHLDRFETYLARIGLATLSELSPTILSGFVADRSGAGASKLTVRAACAAVRVFLRYAHREGVLPRDLSATVGWPQAYRLSTIPRSISWPEVERVLDGVDRRTGRGKRDYAILLLLVCYGLRGREVAALTLDDIDWKRERLSVPERKAGHSTVFPPSTVVADALVDYLRHGRPAATDRQVFFRANAPIGPISAAAVSACVRTHLLRAGIRAPQLGSHTLRHSCVQRLVDADFPLKTIGDYVGHRSPASTSIYAKSRELHQAGEKPAGRQLRAMSEWVSRAK